MSPNTCHLCLRSIQYYGLLEALAAPDKPEDRELLDWLGEDFDAEEFSLDYVNARLSAWSVPS
jgi:hypothetical protein